MLFYFDLHSLWSAGFPTGFLARFFLLGGAIPVLLILFLAASFEELGWRSYALDSLNQHNSYFKATLIFSILWAFWHFPLFFINNYYQHELFVTNPIFAVNFMVSVIPMAFIISWICRKDNGSISTAILFHFIINLSQELLMINQVGKCIETGVLMILAGIIVWREREMFFGKSERNARQPQPETVFP